MKKTIALSAAFILIISISGCTSSWTGVRVKKDMTPDNVKYMDEVKPSTASSDETKQTSVSDAEDIRNLVISFGTKLQMVSLLAPKDILEKSMKENYGEFVSQTLIKKWLENPSAAPGRMTSSPWPDRIKVETTEKLKDNQYEVSGEIIEITSVEKLNGGIAAKRPVTIIVDKINGKWVITDVRLGPYDNIKSLSYTDKQYGFSFILPATWYEFSIVTGTWEGLSSADSKGEKTVETGPKISIRHPKWTQERPRQDIPIMVFTLEQWNDLQKNKFHIGAAPIGPSELGRNSKYVFALPARYNFAFLEGYEEVADIFKEKPLKPTEDFK